GEIRLIVAKEFVDLFRSGSIKKMTVSYAVPLLVLLGMAWLVDFAITKEPQSVVDWHKHSNQSALICSVPWFLRIQLLFLVDDPRFT
ncbi:hypothetical protein N9N12_00755, partial [Candidatus Poseidoniales archaeon]|nr:hypothetical protein [Candidatus Poseidoniales archaeon]